LAGQSGASANARRAGGGGVRADRATVSAESLTHCYRHVFEHNLIGMYWTTLDGRFLDCNRSMARMLGYRSRAELLRRNAVELYPSPGDRAAFLKRLKATGSLMNSELCLRRRDGRPVYILENVSLVRDKCGGPPTIQGTMVDITERKEAEEALRQSEQRYRRLAAALRRLARHVQDVRERERARIARELHDELGQALTVLNMDLHWLSGRSAAEFNSIQSRIKAMSELVNRTLQTLRRICTDLRPTLLDDLGLVAAIEWQTREFETRTGIRCTTRLPRKPLELGRDAATVVFRILQESLTNVARHAQARRVWVSLRVRAGILIMTVRDDGVGITAEQCSAPRSLGLLGMRERAMQWKGRVEISGMAGKGTIVTLRLPVRSPEEAAT